MTENPDTLKAGFDRIAIKDGISRAQVLAAYARYRPEVGHKMLLSEFMALGLYRHEKVPAGFIGTREASEFARWANFRPHKRGLVADKLLFDGMLRGLGFPVPEVQAIFGAKKLPPPIRALDHKGAVTKFLRQHARYPVFGKPLSGQNSQDVISLDGYDAGDDRLRLADGTRLPVDDVVAGIAPAHYRWGYLFQSRIRQHPAISAAIGAVVGSVRVVTFLAGAEARVIGAMWKIPRAGLIADNLWRGALLADVDTDNGRVGILHEGTGPGAGRRATHPDTGHKVAGMVLPHWQEVRTLTCDAAGLLSGLPLVGWDVAIGAQGPVFIEANTIPSLDLLQYGAARPALTPDLRAEIEAEAERLRRQGQADRRERKKTLNARIRTRLAKSLRLGRSK